MNVATCRADRHSLYESGAITIFMKCSLWMTLTCSQDSARQDSIGMGVTAPGQEGKLPDPDCRKD